MMAMLWGDVTTDLAGARRHLSEAATLFRSRMGSSADYLTIMAFQHAMQSGYTSCEAAMKRILSILGEPLPAGPDSHAVLVRRLGSAIEGHRPALLQGDLLAAVEELRRFRHVAMHAYDDFDLRKAVIPVEAAEHVVASIDGALARFRAAIDPAPSA